MGEAVVVHLGRRLGDKGPLAPAGLQQVLGHQGVEGLPEGGAADPQLPGQLHLPRELLPGGQAALHHDHGVQPLRRLLGQTFSLHRGLLLGEKRQFPLDIAVSILYYKVRQCKSCMTTLEKFSARRKRHAFRPDQERGGAGPQPLPAVRPGVYRRGAQPPPGGHRQLLERDRPRPHRTWTRSWRP